MDRRLLKPLLLITIVLILPIVLLAVRGESFAAQLGQWQSAPPSRGTLAGLVVGILAVDVVLPVPSGPISTLAGSHLGVLLGTAASTVGMTLGATIAFALARGVSSVNNCKAVGSTVATRTSGGAGPEMAPLEECIAAESERGDVNGEVPSDAQEACRIHGPWLLVITRPLPIIAEAAVLLVGGLQMPWRTFLPTVAASNLAISTTYAILGRQAAAHGWLPLAVCTSIALPLAIALGCRSRIRQA